MAAPKPNFDFLGAEEVVDPPDEAEFKREVAPRRPGRAAADEVRVRGEGGAGVTLGGLAELVFMEVGMAETDRPIMGGVEMRGVPGLDDLGVEGLDQESKKSSSVSLARAAAGASIPSTTIPLGNLIKKKGRN